MRIAVTSDDFRSVTGHAGRSRNFLVFEAETDTPPRVVDCLTLQPEQTMREFVGVGPHPLDNFDAIITAEAGPGFVGRMAARGVHTVQTGESDAAAAVAQFVATSTEVRSPKPAWGTGASTGTAAGIFKSLANETRLMILFILGDGEKCVSDIEHELGISQPRASQQLAFLRRAGLVASRRLGATIFYQLKTPHILFAVEAIYQVVCEQKCPHANP
jgi:DNA-binding transcriptional ArsR family regulator/predicted Fe-Mo cluster-binding NifX family protein